MWLHNKCKSRDKFLVLLTCFFLSTRLISGSVFIESAVEQVQLTIQKCWPIDRQCIDINAHSISLGDNPVSDLNITYHLLAVAEHLIAGLILPADSKQAPMPSNSLLRQQNAIEEIFHPPKPLSS